MDATARTSRSPEDAHAKRKLRNLLLDKHFQLRWTLRVVVAVAVIVAVMGFFLYRTVADATDQILAQKLGDPTLTPEALDAFVAQAKSDKNMTILRLIGGLVTLVVLLGSLTIIYTHKIAGPIYKMRKLFGEVDGYHLQVWAKLRRADELQDVFIEFESMLRRIREHRQEDTEVLEAIHGMLGEKQIEPEDVEKLAQLIQAYRESVKMIS